MQGGLKQTVCALVMLVAASWPVHSESRSTPKSDQEQRTLVLPYMAVGGAPEGWHFLTVLSIENSRRLANSGTIEFFTEDGRPLHVQLNDNAGLAARSEWRVAGKDSTLLVVSHPGGSFEDGWLRLRLSGKAPIKVIVLVQCYNGEHLFAEAGTVGNPGEPVNGPYYRISTGGSSSWRQWRTPGSALRMALLGKLKLGAGIGAGRRKVEEFAAAAQSLSPDGCSRAEKTSFSSGLSTVARTSVTETGIASWYGDKYHRKISASGSKFDQGTLTAAHRTLPFGTRVKVTNLRNGCSVNVRIVDRGPFVPGRIVDLSSAAARRIEIIEEGVARVRLDILPS
jgi:rare lipoprotein A